MLTYIRKAGIRKIKEEKAMLILVFVSLEFFSSFENVIFKSNVLLKITRYDTLIWDKMINCLNNFLKHISIRSQVLPEVIHSE